MPGQKDGWKDRMTEGCTDPILQDPSLKALSNLNVDEQVNVFNRTILNIMRTFIPHETIVCNDKDLPWFNKRIKFLIQEGT